MALSPFARDEELFVRCKSCGFAVATGIRARASEVARTEIHPREHRCPRCGAAHPYADEDYRHRG